MTHVILYDDKYHIITSQVSCNCKLTLNSLHALFDLLLGYFTKLFAMKKLSVFTILTSIVLIVLSFTTTTPNDVVHVKNQDICVLVHCNF